MLLFWLSRLTFSHFHSLPCRHCFSLPGWLDFWYHFLEFFISRISISCHTGRGVFCAGWKGTVDSLLLLYKCLAKVFVRSWARTCSGAVDSESIVSNFLGFSGVLCHLPVWLLSFLCTTTSSSLEGFFYTACLKGVPSASKENKWASHCPSERGFWGWSNICALTRWMRLTSSERQLRGVIWSSRSWSMRQTGRPSGVSPMRRGKFSNRWASSHTPFQQPFSFSHHHHSPASLAHP